MTTIALAAILSTREPERLYSGLSVLVSTAVDGQAVEALASFGALELLLDPPAGDDVFNSSLRELVGIARDLPELTIYACAAAMQTMGLTGEPLDGVKSTPRFLRDTAGARLIFV